MKSMRKIMGSIIILIGLCFLISSCASSSYIKVNYSMSQEPGEFSNKKIYIKVVDARKDTKIFDEDAAKQYHQFSGTYSLALVESEDKEEILGAFNLTDLFLEAFNTRLKQGEMELLENENPEYPVITINILEFTLKSEKTKWYSAISCEAILSLDGKYKAKQTVNGKSERVKMLGRNDAEKVIGGTFTDIVNRVNFSKLFKDSKL